MPATFGFWSLSLSIHQIMGFKKQGDRFKAFQVPFKFFAIFFRSLELTSTLTITKCLLRSAISWEFAKSGFNAAKKKLMLDCKGLPAWSTPAPLWGTRSLIRNFYSLFEPLSLSLIQPEVNALKYPIGRHVWSYGTTDRARVNVFWER